MGFFIRKNIYLNIGFAFKYVINLSRKLNINNNNKSVNESKKVCKMKFWNKSNWCLEPWIWCVNFDIVILSRFAVDSCVNFFSINFDEISVVSIADVSLMDFNLVDMVLLYIVMVIYIRGFVIQGGNEVKEYFFFLFLFVCSLREELNDSKKVCKMKFWNKSN